MAAGTSSAYKDEYCELVKDTMRDGASFAAFRAEVGIAPSTFAYWRKKHPEFEEACQVANALSAIWWEARAKEAVAKEGSKGAPAIILAGLYNRAQGDWANKQEVVQTTKVEEEALDLSKLTDEELAAYDVVVTARERIKGGTEQA